MNTNQQIFIKYATKMIQLTKNFAMVGTIGSGMSRNQVKAAAKEAVKQSGVKVSAELVSNAVMFTIQERV